MRHDAAFRADRTHNLIVRLRHNVIRAGLRRIALAYSRISLADVAAKLGLPSVTDTESIVSKAIRWVQSLGWGGAAGGQRCGWRLVVGGNSGSGRGGLQAGRPARGRVLALRVPSCKTRLDRRGETVQGACPLGAKL